MLKSGSASRRATLRFEQQRDWPAVQAVLADLLRSCDAQLQRSGAMWIGHCKAMANIEGQVAYASLGMSDAPVVWAGGPLPATQIVELTLYAAIYSLSEQQVAAALDAALSELRAQEAAP